MKTIRWKTFVLMVLLLVAALAPLPLVVTGVLVALMGFILGGDAYAYGERVGYDAGFAKCSEIAADIALQLHEVSCPACQAMQTSLLEVKLVVLGGDDE